MGLQPVAFPSTAETQTFGCTSTKVGYLLSPCCAFLDGVRSIQYRMHPEISALPSRVFYDGRLKDGPDMAKKTYQPWHAEEKFGVYKFFNVSRGREEPSRVGHSLLNKEESRTILALFDRIRRQFSDISFDYRIGVVSMYRSQVSELRNSFRQRYGDEILGKVDFNTVDGFQGQEKDIIILSCVRAGTSLSSVGFLSGKRFVFLFNCIICLTVDQTCVV